MLHKISRMTAVMLIGLTGCAFGPVAAASGIISGVFSYTTESMLAVDTPVKCPKGSWEIGTGCVTEIKVNGKTAKPEPQEGVHDANLEPSGRSLYGD